MAGPKGKFSIIGGAGHGNVPYAGVEFPAMDTAQPQFPEGVPIDLLLVPVGSLAPVAAAQLEKGGILVYIPPQYAAQMRGQFQARPGPADRPVGPPN